MGETTIEKDRNRFSYSERLVVELFLLAYIFTFFLGETNSIMAYIWLGISIIAGFASYFLFSDRGYSLGFGVGLALILTVPLLLFAVPLMNVVIFFAYTLWRIQGNFNGSKINGWPFLIINTFVFVTLTALARLLFVYGNPEVLVAKQMSIYLLTSFLYFFIRMITIWFNGKELSNFKMADANKAFASIVTLGAIVFVSILTLLKPVRLGIFLMFGYLVNGIFTMFGKASSPVLDYIREEAERLAEEEEEEDEPFIDFKMEEEAKIFGASASPFEIAMYVLVFAILIAIIVILIKKKRESRITEQQDAYSFFSRGKKKKENASRQLSYDYSKARDEVRKKFEKFENEANTHGFTRSQSETVNEWFARMGWGKDNRAIPIYNEVRYGSQIPTEKELEIFRSELEKIKEKFLVKEV